ncbi:MAG: VCBS repeat-containing protein [Pirellulaceae bacterium]
MKKMANCCFPAMLLVGAAFAHADEVIPAIRWREHRIDDSQSAGLPLRGADGLAVADLDGDGRLDVAAVHEDCGQPVRISFGGEQPDRWESRTLSPADGEPRESDTVVGGAEDVVVGDVNGDGRPDIVACGESGALVYFQSPESPRDMSAWRRTAIVSRQAEGGSWIRVDLGDLDGDGRLEILGANKGGTEWASFHCIGRPTDPRDWRRRTIGVCRMPINIRAVDIDGDGDLDVLGGSRGESKIALLENLGDQLRWEEKWRTHTLLQGKFTLPTPPVVSIGGEQVKMRRSDKSASSGFMFELADLDGDGRTDIVTETKHNGGLFWLRQPADLNDAWTRHYLGHILPDHATGLALADVDGDGRLDLFVGGYSYTRRRVDATSIVKPGTPCGRLAWFQQGDDPTRPWTRHDISCRAQGMYDAIVGHDVNGDGLPDLIATRGNSAPVDGVIWLEQVRDSGPGPVFHSAWPKQHQSRQQPIPRVP